MLSAFSELHFYVRVYAPCMWLCTLISVFVLCAFIVMHRFAPHMSMEGAWGLGMGALQPGGAFIHPLSLGKGEEGGSKIRGPSAVPSPFSVPKSGWGPGPSPNPHKVGPNLKPNPKPPKPYPPSSSPPPAPRLGGGGALGVPLLPSGKLYCESLNPDLTIFIPHLLGNRQPWACRAPPKM